VITLTRPSAAVMRVAVFFSISVVSAMMATADPISSTAFFYLWPVLFAAYFFSRRLVVAALTYLGVTLLTALFVTTADVVRSDAFVSAMAAVSIVAALVSLMRERELRLAERLELAAHTDPLTGLLNRRALYPQFAALIERARAADSPLSVVMFDLDHFKHFNDAHGHLAGDEALRRTAVVLRSQSRAGDLVARLGGEEFAVILPGASVTAAVEYAERVGSLLGAQTVGASRGLSTSAGIALYASPADASDGGDGMLSRADEALYAAKAAGRCRAAWWFRDELVVGEQIEPAAAIQERRDPAIQPPHRQPVSGDPPANGQLPEQAASGQSA
jgi:diguanylate cyclase (GGDEF)-like protein